MSSNTTVNGGYTYIASASSGYSTSLDVFNAFDRNNTTYWHWNTTGTQWIQIQLPQAIAATSVDVQKRNS